MTHITSASRFTFSSIRFPAMLVAVVLQLPVHRFATSADIIPAVRKAEIKPQYKDLAAGETRSAQWRTPVGTFSGSPVVAEGKVFLGTNNKRPHDTMITDDRGVLMCFNESNGDFLWQMTHPRLPNRLQDSPGMGIQSRPVVQDGRVYYTSNRGELVCLDVNGFRDGENNGPYKDEADTGESAADICWILDPREKLKVFHRNLSDNISALSSPLVVDGYVYWNTGNGNDREPGERSVPQPNAPSLVAVDAMTGEIRWQHAAAGDQIELAQWASPILSLHNDRKQIVFGAGDGAIYAFDPKLGALLWKLKLRDEIACSRLKRDAGVRTTRDFFIASPAFGNQNIIFSLGQGRGELVERQRKIFAIDVDAAKRSEELVRWEYGPSEEFSDGTQGKVVIRDGQVYALSSVGYLLALDERSGKMLWAANLENVASDLGEPVLGKNRIYAATERELFAFELDHRERKVIHWRLSGVFHGTSVAESRGRVFVATSEHLWAID